MKHLFLITALLLSSFTFTAVAETNYTRSDNTFIKQTTKSSTSSATKTTYTFQDSKGTVYPIYITKTGRCFVVKTSAKTGNEYKQYLSEEIARVICSELGVTYQEKAKQ